jgi:restriction system protein
MLSVYPILWHKEIDISYNDDNKALVVDYKLPLLEEVCVVDDNGKKLKEKEQNKLYSSVLYQICLRTIDEIFSQNKNNDVDSITFNGIITAIDKATGKHKTACVMSLQLNKAVFEEIDLGNVDARECFKYLKGVGAAELSSITPVSPIRTIDKSDRRFVDAYGVLDNINSGTNLAAINWQDFENLIREVFEKEFSQNGGEVKITQASRDGGVDAIAFDPDPIRGGKIVIQAKRYTNTVGVSAVRDLYGTLMNEGANNGILVTTSDYGSDAYEFANGKPIKLLNGAELLGLMEKHGYKAYINIKEAKRILTLENK